MKREGIKRKRRSSGEIRHGAECKKRLDVVEAKYNTRSENTVEAGVAD